MPAATASMPATSDGVTGSASSQAPSDMATTGFTVTVTATRVGVVYSSPMLHSQNAAAAPMTPSQAMPSHAQPGSAATPPRSPRSSVSSRRAAAPASMARAVKGRAG